MKDYTPLSDEHSRQLEQRGMLLRKDQQNFRKMNVDIIYPFFALSLCTQGSSKAMYDMQEITHSKNELAFILPGHIMHPISCTDDYTYTWLIVSPAFVLKNEIDQTSSKDLELFEKAPICHLTDEQVQHLLTFINQLEYVSSFTQQQLPRRNQMLVNLMIAGHELLLYYRREQDQAWLRSRQTKLYRQFVNLVITHYKQERNVNFYAQQLDYDPRYFSKIFRVASKGISALDWISQYVITQAKLLIDAHPRRPIKETALQLGFQDSANFCRYFHRVTGITPLEYKDRQRSSAAPPNKMKESTKKVHKKKVVKRKVLKRKVVNKI